VTLSEYEKEEAFLKYLKGWNDNIAAHQRSLLSQPQRVEENELNFVKSTLEKWKLPFDEKVLARPIQ